MISFSLKIKTKNLSVSEEKQYNFIKLFQSGGTKRQMTNKQKDRNGPAKGQSESELWFSKDQIVKKDCLIYSHLISLLVIRL